MSKLELEKRIYRAAAKELSHAEFRVLAIIMTYTNEKGENAHPALTRLIDETGCSRSAVWKALQVLQEKGYLVKTEQGGNQVGKGRANVYKVQDPSVAKGSLTKQKGSLSRHEGFSDRTPSDPPSGHSSGPESSTVESPIQPSESFTVEAPLPPMQLPTKPKGEGPTTEWARFHKHADYTAVLGAYTNAAYWKSQKDWDRAADAESVFWGHLYTLTDIEDIEFPVDQWSIRSTENTREGIGAQVRKILNSAADMKGEPLVWTCHGNLHNPRPVAGIRNAA